MSNRCQVKTRFFSVPESAGEDFLEEVVAFVVHKDEGGEVHDFDFPNGFHAEFGIFHAFDALDALLGEDGCGTADGAEIEAAVFLAGVGHLLRAVALGNHHQGAAVTLDEIHVGRQVFWRVRHRARDDS